jgi:hypothetical protein
MKHYYISALVKLFLLYLAMFIISAVVHCQNGIYTDTTYIHYPRQLKDTVLMNTDHFYLVTEVGLGFNLGPTVTTSPGNRFETNAAPFDLYDFSAITPTKFNIGYAYKNHHFEGSIGMLRERLNISLLDGAGNRVVDYHRNQTYGSLTFRYFYRFPMQIPRLKLMMGAEIGGAFRPDNVMQEKSYSVYRDTGYVLNSYISEFHNFQLVLGISSRMDIKLCKNLTLTLLATILGSPLRGTEYTFVYSYPGSTNQTAQVYSTLLNLNLNAGLKLDLFSHAKKRETYDRLGIQDPFRDK